MSEFDFILRPSSIHGIGVFALRPFTKGETLELFADDDNSIRETVPEEFDRYVVCSDAPEIMCPQQFNRMSVGWYVNCSDAPNCSSEDDVYIALRDIAQGEEITWPNYL